MTTELKQMLFDEMLKSALTEYVEAEEPALQTQSELRKQGVSLPEFSPSFERKMNRLVRRERRKVWRHKHAKAIRRTAAVVSLSVLVGGVTITQVEAIRVPIVRFFLDVKEKYTDIVIESDQSVPPDIPKEWESYCPTYIPEGFFVENMEKTELGFWIEYSSEDNRYYSLNFFKDAGEHSIDTEDAKITETEIRNYSAVIAEKTNGQIRILWFPSTHSYFLMGDLPLKEAVHILESIPDIT